MPRGNSGEGTHGNAGRRPGGRGRSRPPARPGGGGGGSGGYTGGTSHKSSSVEGSPIINVVWGIVVGAVGVVLFVSYGLLHGYGVI